MEALVQNCDMFYPFSLVCGFGGGGFGGYIDFLLRILFRIFFIKIALHDKEKFKKTVQIYTIEINEKKFKINNKKKHTKS